MKRVKDWRKDKQTDRQQLSELNKVFLWKPPLLIRLLSGKDKVSKLASWQIAWVYYWYPICPKFNFNYFA